MVARQFEYALALIRGTFKIDSLQVYGTLGLMKTA